jgi:hypothetical protein
LVEQTHLNNEIRQIAKTYLTDGVDVGRVKLQESMQDPNSGFGILGLTQPEMDEYFKELDQYLTEKSNVFREEPAPIETPPEGVALPKLPAGEYKPRDTFQYDGRTWQVTSVLHTGKGLEASTVFEKNKKSLSQRFDIAAKEAPTQEKPTTGPAVPTGDTTTVTVEPEKPTGGPAAPAGPKEPKAPKPPKVEVSEEEKAKAAEEKAKGRGRESQSRRAKEKGRRIQQAAHEGCYGGGQC